MNFLQKIYWSLTTAERCFFETFSFLCYKPEAKVISVGNLTMGGTGKTPVLFELIKELKNRRICVLTRGYHSKYEKSFYMLKGRTEDLSDFTDETRMLNLRFPEIPVFIGKNRHHAAVMAEKSYKPEIMLVDDGFQYRRLKKDMEILLWDAMSKPEEAALLPFGRLREPVSRIKDADIILLTRCESASKEQIQYWTDFLALHAPGIPAIQTKTVCDGIYNDRGEQISLTGKRVLAFSAIGRPESFYAQLDSIGANIAEKSEFRDHHVFEEKELTAVGEKAQKLGLTPVCTEKDFCKIPPSIADRFNICVLKIAVRPACGSSFLSLLDSRCFPDTNK